MHQAGGVGFFGLRVAHFAGKGHGQFGDEQAVQRVVTVGAGGDFPLGLLDEVAQGPGLQQAGVGAGKACGDGVKERGAVGVTQRRGQQQFENEDGVEKNNSGDIVR